MGLIQSYCMHLGTSNVAHKPCLLQTVSNILRQTQYFSKMLWENFQVVHPVKIPSKKSLYKILSKIRSYYLCIRIWDKKFHFLIRLYKILVTITIILRLSCKIRNIILQDLQYCLVRSAIPSCKICSTVL